MTNKIYNKIKHYRVYIGRYGSTMLIKHCDFPNMNKKLINKKLMNKKYIFKEHSYTKSNNPFLL